MVDVKVHLQPGYAQVQPERAEVVIIGGGIMGMSAAWHLAKRGVGNVVVLERHKLGRGSSAKPMGGVRANFSDPMNVILGKRSLEVYRSWREHFHTNLELAKVGYLFLARTEQEVADLEEATTTQNAHGVNSYMVTPDKAAELNPFIEPGAILAGSFSPDDGYACPLAAVEGYAHAAAQLGVTILEYTEVLDIESSAGTAAGTGTSAGTAAGTAAGANARVDAIVTNRGRIATNKVICAAGAWSAAIGEMAGHPLPVEPVRRMIGITPQRPQAHPTVPFTLDLGTKMYWHNYYNGLLLGISHEAPVGFERDFTFDWVREFDAAADIVAPTLTGQELVAGWAGLYENTPDRNALIGASESIDGFYYCTGFSGHGFLQGPAAGELIADITTDTESFLPRDAYSTKRFGEGQQVGPDVVIERNII